MHNGVQKVSEALMNEDDYILGVDGGGTHCRVQLEDMTGNVLGTGAAGPANIMTDPELALTSIIDASKKAIADLPITLNQIHLAAGLAGANLSCAKQQFLAQAHPFKSMLVVSDLHAACLGAHDGADGALIICGTGSAATAHQNGVFCDKGGYGTYIGDNASGAWLGLEAVKHSLLVFDGMVTESVIFKLLCDQLNLRCAEHLATTAAGFTGADYGKLAPIVVEAFRLQCQVAIELLQEGAHYLSSLAVNVTTHHRMPLCLVGGLSDVYKPMLAPKVHTVLCEPKYSPQAGAIRYAKQHVSTMLCN